jgi:hypothetical protein
MNVCLHEGMKLQARLVQATGLLLMLISSSTTALRPLPYYKAEKVTASQDSAS